MNRGVLVLLVLAVSVAIPTGGLSATAADRDVSGRVASDAEAYVGVEMQPGASTTPANPSGQADATRAMPNATRSDPSERDGVSAPTGPPGRENVSASAPTGPPPKTLSVTVRNRVPHLDRFDAVVSAEPASGDGQTVAERVDDVDDEATVFLSPVSCGDTVRITVRSPDVGMELTRRVPCEP